MEFTPVKTENAALEVAENQVATVLIHLKKLLRIRNQLRSPLLQLPTEVIIHILSYIMKTVEPFRVWLPIYGTCHHIHVIMCTTTELWWKVDFARIMAARVAFLRSEGNPQVIIVELVPWMDRQNNRVRGVLDYWRDKRELQGHRLRTLVLRGDSSDVARFSWIFKRPLPRLHHLKISFFGPLADDEDQSQLPIPDPVALQIPIDLPLQTLDLSNATLPWSSTLFAGLRELRMDFRECETVVVISADELLAVFDASPRLESLSLVQVQPTVPLRNGQQQFTPTRIAQLPNLIFLKLDNSPESVCYILAHMNIPAIDALEIRSHILPSDLSWSLRFFSSNHLLPSRLFRNPPVFNIRVAVEDERYFDLLGATYVTIGGFELRFDFDIDGMEEIRGAVTNCVPPLVPLSVEVLELDDLELSEQEWREFLRSHPEVRSISSSNFSRKAVSKSLWDALSPAGTDAVPLCPKLELISFFDSPVTAQPLLDCLLNRKNAGLRLRCLEIGILGDELVEEFGLLVEELQVGTLPDDFFPAMMVRRVLMNELGFHVLTVIPSGNIVPVQHSIT